MGRSNMADEAATTPSDSPAAEEAPAAEEVAPAAKKGAKPKKEKKATAPAAKKEKKAATPAAHPKYSVMIAAAIGALKDRTGSSRQAILKYICANYKVDAKKAATQLRLSLKRGVAAGSLKWPRKKERVLAATNFPTRKKRRQPRKHLKPRNLQQKKEKKAAKPTTKKAPKKVAKKSGQTKSRG